MIQIIVGGIVAAFFSVVSNGIFRTMRDAIWWNGAIKGGLFVGLILIGVFLLGRRDR